MTLRIGLGILCAILLTPTIVAIPANNVKDRATNPLLPNGWTAVGCYTDSTSARTISTASTTSLNSMTLASCITFCTTMAPSGPYLYAGVEFGRECYCGNTINSPGIPADDSGCNMPCIGDSTQDCGGANRIFIAVSSSTTTSTPPVPPTTSAPSTTIAVSAPTPSIKQFVGSWVYKGCHEDFGSRILQNQASVSVNSAEICTATCGALGYGLAGLEFGAECWCDTYLSFGELHEDTDCNVVCSGDSTELCGAGNRIALYQNTAASPPNPNSCLPAANNQGQRNYQNTGIVAVDINNGEDPLEIWGATPDVTHGDTGPEFTLLSNCENCPFEDVNNFELNADRFFAYAVNGLAIPPRVGESPLFEEFGTEAPYTGYCAQPNPISATGPFIGFPVLSAGGNADLWSLCVNSTAGGRLDVVYSPIDGHPNYDIANCRNVFLLLTPAYALPVPS